MFSMSCHIHTQSVGIAAEEWSLWSTGHFCAEPDLAQETRPEARDQAETGYIKYTGDRPNKMSGPAQVAKRHTDTNHPSWAEGGRRYDTGVHCQGV